MTNSRHHTNLLDTILKWLIPLLTLAPALAVTFTTDTLIDDGDVTYDGPGSILDGRAVSINGGHAFVRLSIANDGTLDPLRPGEHDPVRSSDGCSDRKHGDTIRRSGGA